MWTMTGMTKRLSAWIALYAGALLSLACAQTPPPPAEDIAERLSGGHPAAYFPEAARMFAAGQRDEAVFLFYLGQLRVRTHLAARPRLAPDGDPAVFAALFEEVGRPINIYAFGDIPTLLRTLDAVSIFDRRVPDRFTSEADHPDATRRIRLGMAQFRDGLAKQGDEIRAVRTANGL